MAEVLDIINEVEKVPELEEGFAASVKRDAILSDRLTKAELELIDFGTQINVNKNGIQNNRNDIAALTARVGIAETSINAHGTAIGNNQTDISALVAEIAALRNRINSFSYFRG